MHKEETDGKLFTGVPGDSEDELAAEKERWEKSFHAIGEGMFIIDRDFRILQANAAFAGLVGMEPADIVGTECFRLIHGTEEPPSFCLTGAAVRAAERAGADIYEPHLEKHLSVSVDPSFNALGEFEFAIHLARDVTEQKKAEEELKRQHGLLESLMDAMPSPVFFKDTSGIYLGCNKAFEEYLGRDKDEIVGKTVYDLAPEELADVYKDSDDKLLANPGTQVYETSVKYADGSLHDVIFTKATFNNGQGHIGGIVGIIVDITERKRAEEALRNSEETYRTLIESLNEGVWKIDAEGRTTFTNRRMAEILGYSVEEMLGKHLFDFMDDKGKKLAEENMDRRKRGVSEQHDFEFLKKDGTRIYASLETVPLLDTHGDYAGALAGVMDITARREAEEETIAAEKKYRELAGTLPQVVFETDNAGIITYVNEKGYELFGYTEDDVKVGINALQIIDPADHRRVVGAIQKMMDGRSTGALREYLARRKDGSSFPCTVDSAVIPDGQGNPAGIRGILTDVTERKKTEGELREAYAALEDREARLRGITQAAKDAIILLDGEGSIVHWNPAAEKIFGYSSSEAVGTQVERLLPEESRGFHHRDFGQYVASEDLSGSSPVDYAGVRKDGTVFPAEISISVFLIKDERFVEVIVRDITERKRAEESLQRINAELDGFAHTVSHDLKGPLAAIKSASEMLETMLEMPRTEETDSDIVDMAGVISDGADRSAALINEVLALAAAGQEPSEVREVDVREVVARIISERSAVIAEKGIRVEQSGSLEQVVASPTHVYQVFTNLIGNAIKHNDSERPVISISYLGEDRNGGRRYLVRDNGSGITPGNLKKVFIPFWKGETGETGIGLSTVEKIVKIYGGRIRAYNDGGACFEFVLRDYVGA